MEIKKIIAVLLGASFIGLPSLSLADGHGDTLDAVKERGRLRCGVNTGLAGFSTPDSQGNWVGIDVSVCQAVAVAIFRDETKVDFVPLSAQQRFTALQSGEVDMLSRNTTLTFQREAALGLVFAQVVYYDGQGFITKTATGITSAKQLNNRTVCVQPGTTTELNLASFARDNNIKIRPVVIERFEDSVNAYLSGRCDAYTTDVSGLASIRARTETPNDHLILPEVISKEPLAPAVRQGDDKWYLVVNWSVRALIAAEELGVTSQNVDRLARSSSTSQAVRRLLKSEVASSLDLEEDFAHQIIAKVGNYGEIFEANIGVNTPLGLQRGLNALWTDGGLQYAPPFR